MQRTVLAAVQATDERLIALQYLMRILPVFSSSAESISNQVGLTGGMARSPNHRAERTLRLVNSIVMVCVFRYVVI